MSRNMIARLAYRHTRRVVARAVAFHGWKMSPEKMRMPGPHFTDRKPIPLEDVEEAIDYLEEARPGVLVAYSRGGAVAMLALQEADVRPKVLWVAPAWRRGWARGKPPAGNGVILHGDRDDAVPLQHSCELSKATGNPSGSCPIGSHVSILKDKTNPNAGIPVPREKVQECIETLPDWGTSGKGSREDVERQQAFTRSLEGARMSTPEMFWEDDWEDLEGDPWDLAQSVGVRVLSNKDLRAGFHVDGEIVAALFDASDRDGYEFDIAVRKDWQRRGLGKRLTEMALDLYEENREAYGDGYTLNLDVINPVMERLLRRHGLEETGREHGHVLMTKRAYRRRWKPGVRQQRSKGMARHKRKMYYRKNRNRLKTKAKLYRRKTRNNPAFKRSQRMRRTQNRTRRRASVLTVPDIAFLIGPDRYLGYVHSISPMTGMVTIEIDARDVSPLDSLPVALFLRMAVFLTDEDIEAFFTLVDVEVGPEAYADLDEGLVRECARRYDKDPDSDEFKSDCFDLTDEYDLSAMAADQLDALTYSLVHGKLEGGQGRTLEDADNSEIGGEYDPHLFYGEVEIPRSKRAWEVGTRGGPQTTKQHRQSPQKRREDAREYKRNPAEKRRNALKRYHQFCKRNQSCRRQRELQRKHPNRYKRRPPVVREAGDVILYDQHNPANDEIKQPGQDVSYRAEGPTTYTHSPDDKQGVPPDTRSSTGATTTPHPLPRG